MTKRTIEFAVMPKRQGKNFEIHRIHENLKWPTPRMAQKKSFVFGSQSSEPTQSSSDVYLVGNVGA